MQMYRMSSLLTVRCVSIEINESYLYARYVLSVGRPVSSLLYAMQLKLTSTA